MIVTDFAIRFNAAGCLGLHLEFVSISRGHLASFPWWDDVDADLANWTLKEIPLGTFDSPFHDLDQGWEIEIYEREGWVHVSENSEPGFRVDHASYLAAWSAALEAARELRTAAHSLVDTRAEPLRFRRLRLACQKLTRLPEEVRQLANLEVLDLSYNSLSDLPDLRCLTRLHTLNLAGNRFKRLPDWLGSLSRLRKLNLAENQLTDLPRLPPHLEELYLQYNRFKKPPAELGRLRLTALDMSGNPGQDKK